ncbi:MAG: DNA-binding response regulator [Bacteroidetes bacterium CG12_big_fil_rev_8_21_14_0_65_60_17]|nr:MAG: DNA-binding response regulator [Bacteroidetes bacterium CG12_big_fil_rev_8_21_14_0_65_60_17]
MIRTVIIDDEAPARQRLRKLLSGHKKLEIVGEAEDGPSALELLNREKPDLAFLDIQMPGHDGFEVLDRLEPDARPVVIFTTAYDEYAIKAFEANAVDYLLKPVPKDRLSDAISRASRILGTPASRTELENRLARLLDWMDATAVQDAPGSDHGHEQEFLEQLSIPYRDRILIVPVTDLVSVEISEGITRVFLLDRENDTPRPRLKQHIVSYTLDQLEKLLHPEDFMRVHRSAIVQQRHIKELISWFSGRFKLVLTGGHEVIASRERSKILKDRLMV